MVKSLPMLAFVLVALLAAPGFAGGTRGGRGPLDRSRAGTLKVGDPAPDFELKRLASGEGEMVKLSSFRGKQPVVLIFGSYT